MSSQPSYLKSKLQKSVRRRKTRVLRFYGSLTSKLRMLPDFILIGVQRGGTTSLYNYLAGHPCILPALGKELHFFDLSYNKGLNWYRGNFPWLSNKKGNQKIITGEASPYYIFHPHASKRISAVFPSIKLIVLLRNPVDRAFSHYQHEVRLGFENLSFEEAVAQESSRLNGETQKIVRDENYHSFNHRHYSYLSRGIYVDQLKNWMKSFQREQIQIIKSEDLFESPQNTLSQVVKFLNLPEWNFSNLEVHNRLQYQGMNANTRERLNEYFDPFNKDLYDTLGTDFGWN